VSALMRPVPALVTLPCMREAWSHSGFHLKNWHGVELYGGQQMQIVFPAVELYCTWCSSFNSMVDCTE
jgi:hypothetical protein